MSTGGAVQDGGPRTAARVAGAVLLLAAIGIGLEATTFEVAFVTDAIGPKALPLVVAFILGLAGLSLVVRPDVDVDWPPRSVAVKMVAAVAAFLLYAATLPWIGFWLSTTAVVAVLSGLYGAPKLRGSIVAGALAGILWLLFVVLLGLPLPIGELWML